MLKNFFTIIITLLACHSVSAQAKLDSLLPVRGFCIAAPAKEHVDEFVKFINEELVPKKVNTLVLRVDYNYAYESHPELRDENPLTREDVKKIVAACKKGHIRVIPQVNLLGHQSWFTRVEKLLQVYPQFSETPWLPLDTIPSDTKWPNPWGLYCLSYCPLHPDVHKVVFDIVDEIVSAFEADAFHAGMDEVFYLGDDKCPRCAGRDKAELFAGEVTKIRNHLADKGVELWIWGDRLIDGKTTGIGIWAASYNYTYRAIDMIPKDVIINDWQYNRANPTAAMFALKGFKVVTCPYTNAEVAKKELDLMIGFRKEATKETRENYYGMMQTVWSPAKSFLDEYYGRKEPGERRGSAVKCFNELFMDIDKLRD